MPAETGYPQMDAADDYQRARRRAAMTRLMGWLRGGGGNGIDGAISFDEMIDALGRRSQRILGTTTIPVDAIVGSALLVLPLPHLNDTVIAAPLWCE